MIFNGEVNVTAVNQRRRRPRCRSGSERRECRPGRQRENFGHRVGEARKAGFYSGCAGLFCDPCGKGFSPTRYPARLKPCPQGIRCIRASLWVYHRNCSGCDDLELGSGCDACWRRGFCGVGCSLTGVWLGGSVKASLAQPEMPPPSFASSATSNWDGADLSEIVALRSRRDVRMVLRNAASRGAP